VRAAALERAYERVQTQTRRARHCSERRGGVSGSALQSSRYSPSAAILLPPPFYFACRHTFVTPPAMPSIHGAMIGARRAYEERRCAQPRATRRGKIAIERRARRLMTLCGCLSISSLLFERLRYRASFRAPVGEESCISEYAANRRSRPHAATRFGSRECMQEFSAAEWCGVCFGGALVS